LTGKVIELSLKDPRLRKSGNNFKRFVATETVNNDDIARPTQLFQRAPDIRRFVVRED
jgi:hypothetical protein